MKHIKRALPVCLLLVWALLLAPFFLGAPAAHPATDDFTFAAYTHPTWVQTGSLLRVMKDAVSYALRTWRDWQGTVTGVIVMTLNPAVFSLPHYGGHAVLLLALHLTALFVFLRHMLVGRLGLTRGLFAALYGVLSAASLLFLPDIVEGIYWFNGAWFYTGANAAALLTLTLADGWAERGRGAKGAAVGIACAGLLFALGMDNYITAMMTAAALLMMALQRAWAMVKTPARYTEAILERGEDGWRTRGEREVDGRAEAAALRRTAIRTALLLLPIGAGLLLSVAAPGNSVRMETDGAHQSGLAWLLASVLWTLRDAARFLLRFLLKTPLLAVLCAALPALCRFTPASALRARRMPPVWATALGAYLMLCAMMIPHMYSSGYAGSGRVVNMYHLYVLTALPIAEAMIVLRLGRAQRAAVAGARGRKICWGLSAAALVLCLAGGQIGNYAKLVRDQLDGTQDAYIAQFQNEYALCEAAGEADDVILPAWTVRTMTGKPTAYEDAAVWTNESMAHYFGVKSVRVGE